MIEYSIKRYLLKTDLPSTKYASGSQQVSISQDTTITTTGWKQQCNCINELILKNTFYFFYTNENARDIGCKKIGVCNETRKAYLQAFKRI